MFFRKIKLNFQRGFLQLKTMVIFNNTRGRPEPWRHYLLDIIQIAMKQLVPETIFFLWRILDLVPLYQGFQEII